MLETNDELSLEDALDHACWARNNEIGLSGFSPQQLVFGAGSVVPGITEGNSATDEGISGSEAVF